MAVRPLAQRDLIVGGQTRVECSDIGPGHHIHRSGATWIHGHIGKQPVVVQVVVQSQVVSSLCQAEQVIYARCPAASGHVHVYLYVGTVSIVHLVGDVVVIHLGFPTGLLEEMPVGQRGDEALCLCHVHIQSRVADIEGMVEDEGALHDVHVTKSHSEIGKSVDFMELREWDFLVSARIVIRGLTVERAKIGVEATTRQGGIGAIHLQMAVPFVACGCVEMKRITVEPGLAQSEIQRAADVARCLRIAVQSAVHADALQIAALHIRCDGIHPVCAGRENLHAVNGHGQSFRLHVVDHRFPCVRAATHHINMLQFKQMFVNACCLSFHRAFPPGSRHDDHLVQALYPFGHRVAQHRHC